MILSRRTFLTGAATAAAQTARRPNVLIITSDQESALLPGPPKLPNRERLMRRGIQFTNAFCNTPQCSPARAALMTGLEPHKAGVVTNVDGSSLGKPLSPRIPSIGRVFEQAGYATGYFGKWHLGSAHLSEFGWQTSFSQQRDEEAVNRAADWMRAQKTPWIAWVSLLDPHHIYDIARAQVSPRPGVKPPASNLADLRNKPDEQQWFVDHDQGKQTRSYSEAQWVRYRSFYLDLVERVDVLTGQILEAAGPLDQTIVAYTSDHGDALGEHGLPFKGPFMYEELIRIPFILAVPGQKPRASQQLVTQADLAPSLAAAAGFHWPSATSGVNLLDKAPANRDAVFLEYYAKQKHVNPIRTIRTRRFKLNLYNSGHGELYDLEKDPHEINNRFGDEPLADKEREMKARLDAWRAPLQ